MKAGSHLLSIDDFGIDEAHLILKTAQKFEKLLETKRRINVLPGYNLATLFFEPSTRTKLSFESAMLRLGGSILPVVGQTTSLEKGESFPDMGRVISSYADIAVMRHPKEFSVHELCKGSNIPVINAGDGANEHPSQSLVDLYTVNKSQGRLENLTIGFLGDLKYGRAAHSTVKLLSRYPINFVFISHDKLKLPETVLKVVKDNKSEYEETSQLHDVINKIDVLYVTRVQKERFLDLDEYEEVKSVFQVNRGTLIDAKKSLSVMHPLPRLEEIQREVDLDPRATYFDQVQNGLYVRMALIAILLGKVRNVDGLKALENL